MREKLTQFLGELAFLPIFVNYNIDKIPIDPKSKRLASSTNPKTWGTLEEAVRNVNMSEKIKGVGIILGQTVYGNLAGIDIDECINEDGEIHEEAKKIIKKIDSYTEKSPSGSGVHILFFGKKPGEKCKKYGLGFCKVLELYDGGRYFTLTGDNL